MPRARKTRRRAARLSVRTTLMAIGVAVAGTLPALAATDAALTLDRAERMAVASDPEAARLGQRAAALRDQAVADGQLPDPSMSIGAVNVPTDDFDFGQEAMTQKVIGLKQPLLSPATLDLRAARTGALAAVEEAKKADRLRRTRLAVRLAWLEAYYWIKAQEILAENEIVLENIAVVVRSLYSTGRQNSQHVLNSELELSLLEDRLVEAVRQEEIVRGRLARWIGDDAARAQFPDTLPALPALRPKQDIVSAAIGHPAVLASDHLERSAQAAVGLAERDYLPSVGVSATYGIREDGPNGRDRPDTVSALVSVSIPLFTGARQDRRLAARKAEAAAVRYGREERLRELRRLVEEEYAAWTRSGERLVLYAEAVTERASENVEAAINAYQSDATDFATLMRAQATEFDTRLKELRLRVDRLKSHARLLYVQGDEE